MGAKELMVLVVDDTDDVRQLIRMCLEMKGCRVLEARDGQEGVDVATKRCSELNLILMDLRMPVLDGYEATRRIRARAETCNLPVVAISAHCDGDWREQALVAGAVECIKKPVDFLLLDGILARYAT